MWCAIVWQCLQGALYCYCCRRCFDCPWWWLWCHRWWCYFGGKDFRCFPLSSAFFSLNDLALFGSCGAVCTAGLLSVWIRLIQFSSNAHSVTRWATTAMATSIADVTGVSSTKKKNSNRKKENNRRIQHGMCSSQQASERVDYENGVPANVWVKENAHRARVCVCVPTMCLLLGSSSSSASRKTFPKGNH